MKWLKWYIILLVGLLTIYVLAEFNRPRTIDWTPTFSHNDKIPYGTWIVFNELKTWFHDQKPVSQTEPLYEHVNNSLAENELYMAINEHFSTTKTDEEELYKYIERGNTVFIAAENISTSFTKRFKVGLAWHGSIILNPKDSATINFTSPYLKAKNNYTLERGTLESYFDKLDSNRTTILGVDNYGNADFIRVKIGDGALFMHAAPKAFSNYFALKGNNIDYIDKVFSY
ncbi:MAG: hypothetical protein JST39_03250, partial [Bacteroidetes bacterium]|nr:hypothetical protein [Bacteroidota bacterium]